jgi:hypothetical protein
MPENYPEAAGKHAGDCAALLAASRFDGAGYLAGYVVECVLKTLIKVENTAPPFIHNLAQLSRKAVELASLPSQKTAKYVTRPEDVTILPYGLPTGWQETLRYEAPGAVSEATAKDWVAEAQRLYREVIVAMKLDGVPL